MGDILGYARVSTGDQDVAGQTMRLEQAGAIRVFTDVMLGKSMDRPGRQPLDMAKVEAAIKLVEARISPVEAARQLGIGRSTIYREMRRLGIERPA